ncbi:MAG: ATP-binding cassette domain-containing protein [Flavobacteriales bacterium]|jgi:ABC-type multidrug transport system ATPase subunit|nr:ATP-binding cassette domain-containing protein [Flavobacteriales bacterium]
MSEKILNALLRLFAIIARGDSVDRGMRPENALVLERFLGRQFSAEVAASHMARYQAFVHDHHRAGHGRKRTALNSVKVLGICMQVNQELNQRQKFTVLLHLLEFVHADSAASRQELEFVTIVAQAFNIGTDEFNRCRAFIRQAEREDAAHMLYVDAATRNPMLQARHLHAHGLDGDLRVLHVPSVNLFVLRYLGQDRLLLSGQPMEPGLSYVLGNGASVRPPDGTPVYYSDILGAFMGRSDRARTVFRADGIEYAFPNGQVGLHALDLAETDGRLIGIMGGSGSGKSTLLNVLNGNLLPSRGRVTINGIDVHRERDRIRGVIGHVSQDDLLIEELTVFQNLYYNARLCFGGQSKAEVTERVLRVLRSLGLYETKDLKVGSPLDKTISGGQRKRLNIALELIREPSVLFVDEPTSGLSSRDSENIMDLLKELALKGRLVFVVIHQPSSDIFKLFDRLLLMDQEGHPVYHGDPVDAVVYFKRITGQVDSEVGQCSACGNVNPEQIFHILEARMVDEYGNETDQRRIGPEAWNEVFRAQAAVRRAELPVEHTVPRSTFTPPGRLQQWYLYFKRDLLSKLANRQYVAINLIEAPALAFMMAFFLKYKPVGAEAYVFRQNDNLPQFLFIAVIVALFLGLTVSAEEIIRDRPMRQRERFLDLSRASYIMSKLGLLFIISAVQSLLFVWVGNAVLGIEGMGWPYWAVLFSTSCFANVLGLNVSATFNSAKVIYIMIPVLIIPQLLFSGVIVKFDKLHPWFASEKGVPLIGNIMASRWAYEALAVEQFMENRYEKPLYAYDQRMRMANWKKDLWLRELQNRLETVRKGLEGVPGSTGWEDDLHLLRRELEKEQRDLAGFVVDGIDRLRPGFVGERQLNAAASAIHVLQQHYRNVYREAESAKEEAIAARIAADGRPAYFAAMDAARNDRLAEVVMNKNDLNMIVEYRGELVQKSDPIYLEPRYSGLFGAHFHAPAKWAMGHRVPTLWANTAVLWLMTLLLWAALQGDVFPRLMALRMRRRKAR